MEEDNEVMDGRTDVPEVGVGGWSPARARVGDGWEERWMEVEGRRQATKEESTGGLRSTDGTQRVASMEEQGHNLDRPIYLRV